MNNIYISSIHEISINIQSQAIAIDVQRCARIFSRFALNQTSPLGTDRPMNDSLKMIETTNQPVKLRVDQRSNSLRWENASRILQGATAEGRDSGILQCNLLDVLCIRFCSILCPSATELSTWLWFDTLKYHKMKQANVLWWQN